MAHEALKAAEILDREGISLHVVHLPGIKPVNKEAVMRQAAGKKAVLACEEHSVRGGLSMLISYLFRRETIPVDCVAVMDAFGQSAGSYEELMEYYGLNAEAVCRKARGLLGK